jgi:hypothetical protein
MSTIATGVSRTPWHLWVVAILTLFWNGSGAYTIMMAQAGRLPDVGPEEAAYYAAQSSWSIVATVVALLLPLAAAVALLLRRRAAVWLFALGLIMLVANNAYELAAGTSLALVDQGWMIVTTAIVVIAVLQLVYAWAMKKRGVLR